MNKTLKKWTCALLATVSALGCGATFTACETAHPKVEMTISFNGKTYNLEYKLYRRTAPATVEHFLFLAGNGYYDGLAVHNYTEADRMYTGEYTVSETNLTRKNYFETIATYENYAAFPHSVWEGKDKSSPTYTLKGEFNDNNDLTVGSGFLKESFGSLSMYYYTDEEAAKKNVYYISESEAGETHKGKYQQNLATSAFFISLKTSGGSNSGYCTFATLEKDSKAELEDLQEAIESYISKNYPDDEDSFTETVSKEVFEHDPFLKEYKTVVEFNVPKEAIVVEKVKVKKY